MNWDLVLNLATALGTVGATTAAVYYGSIKPVRQTAKFEIESFRKVDFHSVQANELVGEEGDMLEVGFFIRQISGSPSSHVSILVKKIWYLEVEDGARKEWNHFIPSVLRWAAEGSVGFSVGAQRYCYLGFYGDPPGNDILGNVFALSTTENIGDPIWGSHSNYLPSHYSKLQVELLLSGENVQAREFTLEIKLYDPNEIGPLGGNGLPTRGKIKDAVELAVVNNK